MKFLLPAWDFVSTRSPGLESRVGDPTWDFYKYSESGLGVRSRRTNMRFLQVLGVRVWSPESEIKHEIFISTRSPGLESGVGEPTYDFYKYSESGLEVWSRRSALVLYADNKSDYWFDMFRPFWDESSLGFFDQEMILQKRFLTSDMVLPIRPNIYSQLLESQNLVCSNQECRKHRPKTYGQSAAQMVLRC